MREKECGFVSSGEEFGFHYEFVTFLPLVSWIY